MGPWLEWLRKFVLEEKNPAGRLKAFGVLCLRIAYHVFAKAWEDHFTRRAAALSFFTLINLFPIAGVMLFMLSHSWWFQEHMAAVESAVVSQLMTPAARQVVMDVFMSLSKNLSVLGSGLPGFVTLIVLLVLGTSLFLLVERSLNEVWRAPKGMGGLFSRVSLLWFWLTLMPLLVGSSFALSAQFKHQFANIHLVARYTLPFVVTLMAFMTIYWFLPKIRFRFGAVLTASFVAAFFWEAAKLGLSRYVTLIFAQSPVRKLYGSLALVPISMVWIYYSWIIVILGAELVFVLQNLDQLHVEARRRWLVGKGLAPLSRRAALALLLDVYRAFETDKGPVSWADLPSRYELHPDQADRWFAALQERGILARTPQNDLLPARPPSGVRLSEVVDLYGARFESALMQDGGPQPAWAAAEAGAFLASWGDKSLAEIEGVPAPEAVPAVLPEG